MNQRLQALEHASAHLPRSLETLLREAEALPAKAHRAWLSSLNAAELKSICRHHDQMRRAEGLPLYDFGKLTSAERERILDGDFTPLETCPEIPGSNHQTGETL